MATAIGNDAPESSAAGPSSTVFLSEIEYDKNASVFENVLKKLCGPLLRPFLDDEMYKYYSFLKEEYSVHEQESNTISSLHKTLCYKFVNDNIKKLSRKDYDYKIKNYIDLTKLFLPRDPDFQAFDEMCDPSVLLGLVSVVNYKETPTERIRNAAENLIEHRNAWAHHTKNYWSNETLEKSMKSVKELIEEVNPPDKEGILKRLEDFKKKVQPTSTLYPIEYDFVLFYLQKDEEGAQSFYDKLTGCGLKGCFYDDPSILPLMMNEYELLEYACECSSYYIIYVSENLCEVMQLFSRKDKTFKNAIFAALDKSLKSNSDKFLPFYPTLKKTEIPNIPFALGPLTGLEAESRYYNKHLCNLFGLKSVLKVDTNHQAQKRKEERRKRHLEEERRRNQARDVESLDHSLQLMGIE